MRPVAEHPSPFAVFLSSQTSGPTISPSPGIGTQISGEFGDPPEQFHPVSLERQSEEQPGSSPESHHSGSFQIPFPQKSQIEGLD